MDPSGILVYFQDGFIMDNDDIPILSSEAEDGQDTQGQTGPFATTPGQSHQDPEPERRNLWY